MELPRRLTITELEASLEQIRLAPRDEGELRLIVRRPAVNVREVLSEGRLDIVEGLVGDNWASRGSSSMPDGSANPDMNARAAALVAQDPNRWQLAGDQLYIDLDLGYANLPPGTRITIGLAVVEVTALPHRGCQKFLERFGVDALKFVNSEVGRQMNLRGINARVVQSGDIRVGDVVRKQGSASS